MNSTIVSARGGAKSVELDCACDEKPVYDYVFRYIFLGLDCMAIKVLGHNFSRHSSFYEVLLPSKFFPS